MGDLELEDRTSRIQSSEICSTPAGCVQEPAHERECPPLLVVEEVGRDAGNHFDEEPFESDDSLFSGVQSP